MGNAIGMQVLEGVDDFGNVENLDLLCQLADIELDEVDELASLTVLLHEVEIGLVLEGVLQLVDARVLHGRQQLLLHHGLVLLLLPLQLLLLDLLHGVDLVVGILDHHVDVAVGPLAQLVLEGEVLDAEGGFLLGRALGLSWLHLHDYISQTQYLLIYPC